MSDKIQRIDIAEFRNNVAHWRNTVQYGKKRIILTKYGKDVAVLVPIEDLEALQKTEEK